jgi:hypothetical protein
MRVLLWSGTLVIALPFAAFAAWKGIEPETETGKLQLTRIGEMSAQRAAHHATLLGSGHVLVTGGCTARGCSQLLSSAEIYDPTTRRFTSAATMSVARVSHEAVALADGRVLVTGGWTGRNSTASAELYDPATGKWSAAGNMTEPRMSHSAILLADGRVLIAGGEVRTGATLATAELFDPATLQFSPAGAMRTPRSSHVTVGLADGRVLLAGGHRARGAVLASAEIYDPRDKSFHDAGEMLVARHKHGATLLSDGRVLIVGGSDASDYRGRFSSTELFDPRAQTFSRGPDMRWARYKIRGAVVTLPTGAVMVGGGGARAEIWSPGDDRFAPIAGSLDGAQAFSTATVLGTEEVLLLGGYDEQIQSSAAAWLIR